jgi:serine/threonine protein kinase
MELCDETLSDFITKRQSMIDDDINENMTNYLKIFLSLTKAIEYIHKEGIIHRDLKPANIFIINGEIRVGDFGLATMASDIRYAKFARMGDDLDYHTKNVGTMLYAANEQLNSHFYDNKVIMFNLVRYIFIRSYFVRTCIPD